MLLADLVLIKISARPGPPRQFRAQSWFASLMIDITAGRINVTVSAGISSRQPADISFDDLAKRADDALYQAKSNGRNRVVCESLDKSGRWVRDTAAA